MNKHLKVLATSTALVLTIAASSIAHAEDFSKSARPAEQSYDFRTANMTIYKWYLGPMGAMMKGKIPFDAKVFAQNAEGLAAISKINILEGFPKASSEDEVDDSNAKADIWKNTDDFAAKFKAFQTEAAALSTAAKSGDEAAMKAQFGKAAKTCSTCHKEYKTK